MHSLRHISDEDADRLLNGDLPAGDPALDELAAFVLDVGVAYSEPPTEPVRARHLDAMRRAARPRAAGWNPSAEQGSAPGRDGPGLPERIRRGLATLIPRPMAVAAVLAFCLAFSGLTAAGALPDRVQAAVADAVRAVGVSVPDPDAKPRSAHPHIPPPEPMPTRTSQPPAPVRQAQIVAPPTARSAPKRSDGQAKQHDPSRWQEVDPPPVSAGPTEATPVEPPAQAPPEVGEGTAPQPEAGAEPLPDDPRSGDPRR